MSANGDNERLMVSVCVDADESSMHELDLNKKNSNYLSPLGPHHQDSNGGGGPGCHGDGSAKRHFFRRPTSTPPSPTAANSASACGKRRGSLDERNLQLTIILVLVSSSYFIAIVPMMIHFFMSMMDTAQWIDVDDRHLGIFGYYSKTLYIGGFAINFFLYTVSGRVFRDQLRTIVCSSKGAAAGSQCCPAAGRAGALLGVDRKRRLPPASEYVRPGDSTAPPDGTLLTTSFIREPASVNTAI